MSQATTTTDHDAIRQWVEERNGHPATVKGTGGEEPGILRIDFREDDGDALEPISWDEFFAKFDQEDLEFLYQTQTDDGQTSRFCKFISQEEAARK